MQATTYWGGLLCTIANGYRVHYSDSHMCLILSTQLGILFPVTLSPYLDPFLVLETSGQQRLREGLAPRVHLSHPSGESMGGGGEQEGTAGSIGATAEEAEVLKEWGSGEDVNSTQGNARLDYYSTFAVPRYSN